MNLNFYSAQQSLLLRREIERLIESTWLPPGTGDGSRPKYPRQVVWDLSSMLTFQTYGTQIPYLCCLVIAANRASGGKRHTDFLYGGDAGNSRACAAHFRRALAVGEARDAVRIEAGANALSLAEAITGRRIIEVKYSAAPLLFCLLEFLHETIGLAALEPLVRASTRDDFDAREFRDQSNRLENELYHWLEPHVLSKHYQRAFRMMSEFFEKRLGGSDGAGFTCNDIDDNAIWSLWTTATAEGWRSDAGLYPRKFGTSFTWSLLFRKVMEEAEQIDLLERPAVFDPSKDWIETASWDEPHAVAREDRRKLDASAVAFFSRRQIELLEHLNTWNEHLIRLNRSYLRNQAFGSVSKVGGGAWKDLTRLDQFEAAAGALDRLILVIDNALQVALEIQASTESAAMDSQMDSNVERIDFARAAGKALLKDKPWNTLADADDEERMAFFDLAVQLAEIRNEIVELGGRLAAVLETTTAYNDDRERFMQHMTSITESTSKNA